MQILQGRQRSLAEQSASALPQPSILLASIGRPFHPMAVDRAIEIARETSSFVHVMSIARVYGTALGLQHPGLYPSKREWQEQRAIVQAAVERLEHADLDASGGVIASRNASKVIAREARRLGCHAIVVGAPPSPLWMRVLLQDDVQWLLWRSSVPVVAVPHPPARS